MKPPNWDRIQDIYLGALALPHSERRAFVENAFPGDPDSVAEVISLLEAAERSSVLDRPVARLDPSDTLVGTTIDGRYRVERELALGGMSQVYVALDLRLNESVVIKILSEVLVQNSYARQHFNQEVEALVRIRNPGVVDVRDRGALPDGRPYIVMEYVDGELLRSQIPNEGMNLERAASILSQIGDALEHVHKKGIFHRDVKPENIILKSHNDAVVLIDFGIAKVTDSAIASTTVDGISAGTLAYMSPEQLRGEPVTAASDIYSMAVAAYEMITGRRPFSPSSAAQLLDFQRQGVRARPADLRPGLSKGAQRVLLRALAFNPADRYQNAREFAVQLTNALRANERDGAGMGGSSFKRLAFISCALIIAALITYAIYKPPKRDDLQSRGFNYWITVQRTREGKDYLEPYKSNGNDIFDNGDKFKLHVLPLESGYLYIFNEAPPEPNTVSFKMIYPKLGTNNGSASVGANQTIEFDWITFRGPAGAENFWIVWSVAPINELESATKEALRHSQAGLTNQSLVAVKEYLKTMDAKVNARASRMSGSQEVQVRKRSDIVLTLAEIKHR